MDLPEQLTERFPFLYTWEDDWQPLLAGRLRAGSFFTVFFSIKRIGVKACS